MTNAPVAWLYMTETLTDVALGFCILTLFSTIFVMSLVVPQIMTLHPSYAFFMFSGFSLMAAIYIKIFIKETKGLSDKDKKMIYVSKKYL